MNNLTLSLIADDMTVSEKQILSKQTSIDASGIFSLLDELKALKRPVKEYLDMSQEEYYRTESDHKLTIQEFDKKMSEVHDRILTNHVDGHPGEDINFGYNHENAFPDGQYANKIDFHVLTYGLKVVGAMIPVVGAEKVGQIISKDAVISLALAVNALSN